MKQKLAQILKTKTIQHSLITLSGTIINGLIGAVFFLLLARSLGPKNFGIVSFSIIILTLISDIADLGINTGIINFVSKNYLNDLSKVRQILKLSLESKLLIWLVVLIIGWLVMPFISFNILQKPELSFYLRLSLVGVGGALVFSFATSSLQALQRFKLWSFINISMNAIRLALAILLIYGLILTPTNALLIYISITFLGFFIALLFLPKDFLTAKNETSQFNSLFHFNKWVALTIVLSAISSRIDSIFLTKLSSLNDLGIYSVANQLTSYLPQLSSAIAVVAAPKFGSMTNTRDAFSYFRKLGFFCIGLSLLGLLVIPLGFFLIPIFYGSNYQRSSLLFVLLFIANLLFLISTPAYQAIYYYFSKSKIAFIITLIIFVVNTSLMWVMIKALGPVGAALTVVAVSLLNLIISTTWVMIKFKGKNG
ncbi:oligosaccharide flippase family protein [Candidatus Daviesbacteria bacterium]|nr:oligosaccharide flippase family protein [Candidatus Daviesbacteria bacterium]